MERDLATLAARLRDARHACVMTGAGVSAESGIPTFRGKDGLWNHHRAADLATPGAFARDPCLVWNFYAWRRKLLLKCRPNPAHHALARLEERIDDFWLITQNVDGLHRQAGSRNLIELHGDLWIDRCVRCGHARRVESEWINQAPPETLDDRTIPRCPECGALMRPGVVWFGEALPFEALLQLDHVLPRCEVMLVVGTSGTVQPAASFVTDAARRGAFVAEVNPERSPLSEKVDLVLSGKAAGLLPRLLAKLEETPFKPFKDHEDAS